MFEALWVVLGYAGVAVSILAMVIFFCIGRSDAAEWDANRRRLERFKAVITGRVATKSGGGRDYRVHAGLAVDKKDNTWSEQGALSAEAIANVTHSRH